jgi:hypothetical protein
MVRTVPADKRLFRLRPGFAVIGGFDIILMTVGKPPVLKIIDIILQVLAVKKIQVPIGRLKQHRVVATEHGGAFLPFSYAVRFFRPA